MLSETIIHSSGLKELLFNLDEKLQYEPYLGLLNGLPNIEKLSLDVSESQSTSLSPCKPILAQIQTLKNLTTLSLKFRSMPNVYYRLEDEAYELKGLVSDLDNLKSLELVFGVGTCNEKTRGYYCGLWLKDIFQAIGEKSNLEKLSLSFSYFDFERSMGSIWKSLL